jgi:hypothetical protein
VLAHSPGLAIAAAGRTRLLPWSLAADLLSDPDLIVQTLASDALSPWDNERLFAALVAGEDAALRMITASSRMTRAAVQNLPRHPRPWAHFLDLEVLAGDFPAACCRAGLRLPGADPLVDVALMAELFHRNQGQVTVRGRLLSDHPWLGSSAWLSSTGQLAENVVLEGLRREQVRCLPAPGALIVRELLGPGHGFEVRRADVRAASEAILTSTARWDEHGHLAVEGPASGRFPVGGTHISLGIGGLHSVDLPGVIDGPLVDLDVASYYPSLIARDELSPPQLPEFATRTRRLLQRRLAAKRAGDSIASTALKYVINSLYGQLGNARSGLFSPADALRVVLTGQLHLLQLIDGILDVGGELISANTDGIVVRGDPEAAASAWEARTALQLERTPYARLWRTSVNDYLAIAPQGVIAKAKGRFGGGEEDEGSRRSAAPIIARAVTEYLLHQRPVAATIAACQEVTAFTLWRRANGLQWGGQDIETRVVRWINVEKGAPLTQTSAQRQRTLIAAQAQLVEDPGAAACRISIVSGMCMLLRKSSMWFAIPLTEPSN